jgi:hypothetical protein
MNYKKYDQYNQVLASCQLFKVASALHDQYKLPNVSQTPNCAQHFNVPFVAFPLYFPMYSEDSPFPNIQVSFVFPKLCFLSTALWLTGWETSCGPSRHQQECSDLVEQESNLLDRIRTPTNISTAQ